MTSTSTTAPDSKADAHRQSIVGRLMLDRPAFHLGGEQSWNSLPETLAAIRDAVEPGDATLETGVGASTVVFAACGARHVAISPERSEHERVSAYCEQIGVGTGGVRFVEGLSDDLLPSMLGRERTLDVAFIDGAHSFPYPEVDWFYVTRALKVGGRLVMDDISIPAVTPLFHHMRLEDHWRVDAVLDGRAAAFTLLGLPAPEDWRGQQFNAGYPDLSFAGPRDRIRLEARHRLIRLRAQAAQRYPALRRFAGALGRAWARGQG